MTNMTSPLLALLLFAQQVTPAPSGVPMLVTMGLMFGGMYFLLIAPQRKKQKAHEKMLSELQSGAEVITTGGIYGTITNVKDDRFVLRISDNTKIEVGKSFIQSVVNAGGAEEKK